MDIASPSGGLIPLDPESLSHEFLRSLNTIARYKDRNFMNLLENTKKVSDVRAEDYDAIYLTGGHGVMFDFPNSKDLADLIARFYESGRVVSSVCHGATGLLNVKLSDGQYLINGKKVTGFSWPEEVVAERQDAVPFSLEGEMRKRGAAYSKADKPFETYVVRDRNLITGQNPGSAAAVADAVVASLHA
jgi:putative intracellular protease/amidase